MPKTNYDVYPTERLYLLRDDKKQDIYVDLRTLLPQHQVDGIRFLFRQFKKKQPGVILNDPSGYGKCLQVVLFITAVRPLLNNKPVFIMCDDNEVENWVQHFQEWTDCNDDVAVKSNPYTKKLIHISTLKDAYASRRDWSIAVINDNSISKDVLKAVIRADYKIWVTSVDMKENLRTFSYIYEWLHPKQKFNFEDFVANKNDPRDVVSKSILLDAYLEDIVMRRDDFWSPFKKPEIYLPISESPQKVSRKNKDPTGTKVKRSKKQKNEEDNTTIADTNKKPTDTLVPVNTEDKKTTFDTSNWFNFDNDKPKDVEAFIRNREPVSSPDFHGLLPKSETERNVGENAKNTDNSTKTDDPNTMDFENAINDIVNNENNLSTDISQDYLIENDSSKEFVQKRSEKISKSIDVAVENKYSEVNKDNLSHRDWGFNTTPEMQISNNSANNASNEYEGAKVLGKVDNNSKSTENGVSVAIDPLNGKSENDENKTPKGEASNGESKIKVERDDLNSKVAMVGQKNITNIDIKLSELEEQALKKFKGSFLDRLF